MGSVRKSKAQATKSPYARNATSNSTKTSSIQSNLQASKKKGKNAAVTKLKNEEIRASLNDGFHSFFTQNFTRNASKSPPRTSSIAIEDQSKISKSASPTGTGRMTRREAEESMECILEQLSNVTSLHKANLRPSKINE